MEGPDWVPGQIPPKIRSPQYGEGSSDASSDTQVACAIETVSVTTALEPDEVAASTSPAGDTRKVELTPLLGLSQQFMQQMEREIQKQIQEQSRKLVQEVLHQSANQVMLPPSSEAARASLHQCFQTALAAPCPTSTPPPESEGRSAEEPAQYSLAYPFAGINPPPPEVLKESCPMSQSSHGRAATCSEPPKVNYPPDEKKRRSNSCPRGEAEPKCGRSSGAEPSWNLSQIGGRHSDKAPSQPAREPEAPESTSKLKSVVRKVRLDKAKPANFEDLGLTARSRYDTTGRDRTPWDKSRPLPNPPFAVKMITATASHVLAIPTEVRAIPIKGQADTTGIPARAPTKSQLSRKTRAWLPSYWPARSKKSVIRRWSRIRCFI